MNNCKTILPKKCCKDILTATIAGNENINNVTFPENPCTGSLYIVKFDDSLVIYKYQNGVWSKSIDQQVGNQEPQMKTWVGDLVLQGIFTGELNTIYSNIGDLTIEQLSVSFYQITTQFIFTGPPKFFINYPPVVFDGTSLQNVTVQTLQTDPPGPTTSLTFTIQIGNIMSPPVIMGSILPIQIILGDNFLNSI